MNGETERLVAIHQIYLGVEDVVEPGGEFECPSDLAKSLKRSGAARPAVVEKDGEEDGLTRDNLL